MLRQSGRHRQTLPVTDDNEVTASFVHEEGKAGTRLCRFHGLFVEKVVELCPALLQTIYSRRELIALDKKVLGASFTI